MVGPPSVDLFVCDRSANQSRRGCARRPEQDRHGVREAGASSSLYPPQDRKGLSNTGFSGSFLRSRNTRQRRGRRGGRERFESSQEQQSLEAFVDHGVQSLFDRQVFLQRLNCCGCANLDQLVGVSELLPRLVLGGSDCLFVFSRINDEHP